MSDIFAIYTNSYLQARSSNVNPRIINRSVNLARNELLRGDCSYYEPPWFRVTSQQPDVPTDNADVTKRAVAFGALALPKLRREIHDSDDFVVIESLLSLCDLVHDPELAYEAIELKIPDRLSDKLEDPLTPIREAAALILSTLAEFADGKEAILTNPTLLDNLINCVGDSQMSVRLKAASCFEMIARSWIAADELVEKGLLQILLEIVDKDEVPEIIEFHLDTLKSLMYDCGKCVALQQNGFRIFMNLLDSDNHRIVCQALDCLMILTSTKKGKKLAIQKNLLKILTKLLHYENSDVCTAAASVVMFCTVKTRAKFLAAEIKSLAKRLFKLSTNPLNRTLQMYSLKALTNICEHPMVRKEVREHYSDGLKNLQVDDSNVEFKKILLQVVGWVPHKWEEIPCIKKK